MSNKKIFALIFIMAFSIRLGALLSFSGEKSLIYVNDSQTYLQVAKNIINHGVYSMEVSDNPHPDNFRTPLYPLFLLPFVWLNTSLYFPVIVQILLISLGMVVIFFISQKIFNPKIALIATIFFALEPLGALFSAQIMTESIFTPIFVIAVLFFVLFIKFKKNKDLLIGSILLALAALMRPIAFYLFPIIGIALLLGKIEYKQATKKLVIGLTVFLAITSPWLYFSIIKVHSYSFSSIIGMQLYEYHGKYFDQWRTQHGAKENDRLPEIDLSPINNTLDAQAIPPIKAIGLAYIKKHWPQYVVFHLIRIPNLFTDSGYISILNGINQLNIKYDTTHKSISSGYLEQINLKELDKTIDQILSQPVFLVLLIADLLFVIIALLAFLQPLTNYLTYKIWPKETIFILVTIIIYAIIAAPIASPRFRIPINIFLFLLATNTIFSLKQLRSKKYDPNK